MKEKNKEIYDVFNYRYACKKFNKDKKVSDEDFATIIESARLSPSKSYSDSVGKKRSYCRQ